MGSQIQSTPKWKAKLSTTLEKAPPDQIWLLFLDFFNLHKWFPGLATCRGVHGTNGEPGAIRYCAGFSLPESPGSRPSEYRASGRDESVSVSWSKEKLVSVDRARRSLSYEIVESNIGFESYVSTVGIIPRGDGCAIEWEFVVDPVEGWEYDDLVKKYEVGLKGMTKKMEDHISGIH